MTEADIPAKEYRVSRTAHGIAVFGALPLGDFNALLDGRGKDGYRWMRPEIADVLGAAVAVVRSDADAQAWRAQLGIRLDHPDWLMSGDTGISSKTIYATFTDRWAILGSRPPAAPRDSDDFGRCHRLLVRYPEWRSRLAEVAVKCSQFAPLVSIWDVLTALYAVGDHRGVSDRIRQAADALQAGHSSDQRP